MDLKYTSVDGFVEILKLSSSDFDADYWILSNKDHNFNELNYLTNKYLLRSGIIKVNKCFKYKIVKDLSKEYENLTKEWLEENMSSKFEIFMLYYSAGTLYNQSYAFYFNSDEDYLKFILAWGDTKSFLSDDVIN